MTDATATRKRDQNSLAGLPRTQAVRLDGLRAHHVGREFVALGRMISYGYRAEGYWVSTTGFAMLENRDGATTLRYFVDGDA